MSVVMLAGKGSSTWMVANALQSAAIPLRAIVMEEPVSPWRQLRRRASPEPRR